VTAKLCDGVITTNGFIAAQAKAFAPELQTLIIPNFLNRRQQEYSNNIYNQKLKFRYRRDGRVHIGYFSGTPTHSKDFQVVDEALAATLRREPRHPAAHRWFFNALYRTSRFKSKIEQRPLQDFVSLQRYIGEVETNIAPLHKSLFTDCKSELKFFEAAITGTITIASRCFSFENNIRSGENGYLASGHEWAKTVEVCTALSRDWRSYAELAETGFREANQKYAWNRFGAIIHSTLLKSPNELGTRLNGDSTAVVKARATSTVGLNRLSKTRSYPKAAWFAPYHKKLLS
jgi:hypothetical protein